MPFPIPSRRPSVRVTRPTRMVTRTAALSGLGDALQTTTSSLAIGTSALGIAGASGVGWAAAAIPVVGPIVAGVTVALSAIFNRKGPKQKIAATKIADEAEIQLKDNVKGYLAHPTPEAQQQALANFDYVWSQLISTDYCGNPALGDAGKRCISERQRGGKNSWGADWFQLYRDPIANTAPTMESTGSESSNSFTVNQNTNAGSNLLGAGIDGQGLLAIGLMAGLAFVVIGEMD